MNKLLLATLLLSGLASCKKGFQQIGVDSIQATQWVCPEQGMALYVTPTAFIFYIKQKERHVSFKPLAHQLLLLREDTVALYLDNGRVLRMGPTRWRKEDTEGIDWIYATDFRRKD